MGISAGEPMVPPRAPSFASAASPAVVALRRERGLASARDRSLSSVNDKEEWSDGDA